MHSDCTFSTADRLGLFKGAEDRVCRSEDLQMSFTQSLKKEMVAILVCITLEAFNVLKQNFMLRLSFNIKSFRIYFFIIISKTLLF